MVPIAAAEHFVIASRHAALVHRLGGEACVVPVPAGNGGDLFEVGALAGLPVWSMLAHPADAVRRARWLTRRGVLGLLLSEDGIGPRLGLAVTVAPVRLAILDSRSEDLLLFRRIRRAAIGQNTGLGAAIALADALDLDATGRRAFRLLHGLIHRATTMLPERVPLADRHSWALMQVTRLFFLRFVESEGWLDGNPRFLAEAFGRCLAARRDPTRHLLHPLFFGTLNRPASERSRLARDFGAIPFLNGGLFEPHPLERRWHMRLPVEFWHEAFTTLVDRIDVSLDRDRADGSVTPELLGRVFEGVMESEERQREGAFFTPPALVEAITREAIACHLAPKLARSESELASALDDPDPALQAALLDIRVLDPAAGSGAFLVGALGLLHGPGQRDRNRVNHLVTKRLYGVDRHPGAVQLAELRLWLEVLRAQRGDSAAVLPPLPNLDTTIRAGDALIDPVITRGVAVADATGLAGHQARVAHAHGAEKRRAVAALARAELMAVLRSLREHEARIERRVLELLEAQRVPSLFHERRRIDHGARHLLRALRADRAAIRAEQRRLKQDSTRGPFAMSVAFAPVLSNGGFDLVLGNPPWVRAERIPPGLRAQLAGRYRWWTSGDGKGWRHLPDLAVAFVERSTQLLRSGGTMALLVPAKLATAGYATAMRAGLGSQCALHRVADLTGDPRAGFEATTYPFAIIASRRSPLAEHGVRLGLQADAPCISQHEWQGNTTWSLGPPRAQALLARLLRQYPPLREAVAPQLGVKTGANEVFLDPPERLAPFCRLAVRGRDVGAFRADPRTALLWPADARGRPVRQLPAPLAAYLEPLESRLRRRSDLHEGPWWRLFRTGAATAPHRVVWCDLALALRATTLADPAMIPLNSCYVAALPSATAADALTAWLNSTWIGALARLMAEPASGQYARFGARAVGSVPLPGEVLGDPVLAAITLAAADHDVREALDRHVAQLLGLGGDDCEALGAVATNSR